MKKTICVVVPLAAAVCLNAVSAAFGAQRLPESYTWNRTTVKASDTPTGVVITPNGAMLASFLVNGIYSSRDNGKHWSKSKTGITHCWVNCMIQDSSGSVYAGTGRGIYRSADNGVHWKLADPGLRGKSVVALTAGKGNKLYALVHPCSLYSSEDHGKHWRQMPGELDEPMMAHSISADSADNVYAVAGRGIARYDMYKHKWQTVYKGDDKHEVSSVSVDKRGRVVAAVGVKTTSWDTSGARSRVIVSSDRGKHWIESQPFGLFPPEDGVKFGPGGELLAASEDGLMVSRDGGTVWDMLLDTSVENHNFSPLYGAVVRVTIDTKGTICAVGATGNSIWVGRPSK